MDKAETLIVALVSLVIGMLGGLMIGYAISEAASHQKAIDHNYGHYNSTNGNFYYDWQN